ncbi:hypothetical protein PMI07_006091 [Rhizobium sp. CF080]|uniref:ABC transporter substrate-binding protein n=1 Tax=Rhizobium sp. (strain CF080) TaxID=1144310 RepID=UPI0003E7E126|nr:ABC transporter substrate-binding protein [Rhizobium sp. CF080]EUB99810.1 hypothetical protein PMI07_006091 [Rhizobium sp. CF080]
MLVNRRTMLTSIAGAAMLPFLPSMARAATPLSMQLAWIPNIEYAGLWVALEKGYMSSAGVDFTYAPGGPNAPQGPVAVAAGNANVSITGWIPFIDAVNKGNDFVLIGVTFQRSPLGILSLAKRPILKPADMVGATFLGKGATVKTTLEATLAINKLPPELKLVEVGYSPEPLVAGQGDGHIGYATDQPLQLKHMGMTPNKDYFFTLFDDLGFKSYSGLLFTTRAYLNANRPAVVGFVKAMIQGWAENSKDPKVAAKYATEKYGRDYSLNYEHQIEENEVQIGLLRPADKPNYPLFTLDKDLINGPMIDAAKASGRTSIPDLSKCIDYSVADEAHAALKG